VPKYVNSPRTCLYHKGEMLFGLWDAREAIAAGAQPVIVEGPFDAIAVATACTGRCAGVAPCGTALTAEQVRTLRQVADLGTTGMLVAFDSDTAGRLAAIRAYHLLTPYTHEVSAIVLPAGQDPAQVFVERGPSALAEIATHLHPLADLVTDAMVDRWSRWLEYPEGQINALRATAPVIAAMPVPHVARQVARLAHRLGLDHATVTEAVTDALPQVIARTGTTSPGERAVRIPYRTAAVAGCDVPGDPAQALSHALTAAPGRAPPGPTRDDRTSLPSRRTRG
jgi:DNA primase